MTPVVYAAGGTLFVLPVAVGVCISIWFECGCMRLYMHALHPMRVSYNIIVDEFHSAFFYIARTIHASYYVIEQGDPFGQNKLRQTRSYS